MTQKGKFLLVSIVSIIALLGVGGYFVARNMSLNNSDGLVKDVNALKIGIAKESFDDNENSYSNTLIIQVFNDGNKVIHKTLTTNDESVWLSEKKYDGFVFVDLTKEIKQYTNNLGISIWHKSDRSRNYIQVQSMCNATQFTSTAKIIDDSGRWLIDVPLADGENVSLIHSTIYTKTSYRL